jgi:hypothetical protein
MEAGRRREIQELSLHRVRQRGISDPGGTPGRSLSQRLLSADLPWR